MSAKIVDLLDNVVNLSKLSEDVQQEVCGNALFDGSVQIKNFKIKDVKCLH